jgi:hypothetical protein
MIPEIAERATADAGRNEAYGVAIGRRLGHDVEPMFSPAPGKPKLNDAQRQAIAQMIDSGPIPAVHGVVRCFPLVRLRLPASFGGRDNGLVGGRRRSFFGLCFARHNLICNAAKWRQFECKPLIFWAGNLTLNQRVQCSSPCANSRGNTSRFSRARCAPPQKKIASIPAKI